MPRRPLTPDEKIVSRARRRAKKLARLHAVKEEFRATIAETLRLSDQTGVLTHPMWDLVVRRYNDMNATKRTVVREACARDGHHWARTPLVGVSVCTRCLRYS